MIARCRVCGRVLRSVRWRVRGIGPVCARRLGDRPAPRIPTPPPPDHIPGQTELPLQPMQPSLWSL